MQVQAKAGFRDWIARGWTRAAIALMIAGVLFLLVEAQSPSRLYWTGQQVTGTNSGGIVYYQVHGEQYTVDDTGPVPAHDTPTTVYVDPDDPGHALLQRPTRWIDAAAVLVWFVAAAACLIVGAVRHARGRRGRAAASPSKDTFGEGLDSDWVRRTLDRRRHADRTDRTDR